MMPEIHKLAGSAIAFELRHPELNGESDRHELDGVLAVLISDPGRPAEEIGEWLISLLSSSASPSEIWLIGIEDQGNQLRQVAQRSALADLPSVTQYVGTPRVRTVLIDRNGEAWRDSQLGESDRRIEAEVFNNFLSEAMAAIFRDNGGLLHATRGFHYKRPGGSHSDGFLRTANVLHSSSELFVIAMSIHARIGSAAIRRVYTDSASINSVALEYAQLRDRVHLGLPPVIESFGSWDGLRNGFDFGDRRDALVLISASTSGAMYRRIRTDYQIASRQIITLYYLADRSGKQVLSDLTLRKGKSRTAGSLTSLKFYPDGDTCELCENGSAVIELIGDELLPASPSIEPIVLLASDAPPWLGPTMHSLAGTGAVRVHGSDDVTARPRAVLLRLLPFLDTAPVSLGLYRRLQLSIKRGVPADTRLIIHLGDADSAALANNILESLQSRGAPLVAADVVPFEEIRSGHREIPDEASDGIVVVAASVVASGRSLLSVSRSMRSVLTGGAISYVIGVARLPDTQQWAQLASDLGYGELGPTHHAVNASRIIYLPPDEDLSSWDREASLWTNILNAPPDERLRAKSLATAMRDRLAFLRDGSAAGGLQNNAFLPSYSLEGGADEMKLQPKFAFWNWDYTSQPATQAEVFLTIALVMQQARTTRAARGQGEHNWVTWSPRNFSRFNDGVIQASILRASRGRELNFASHLRQSEEMVEIIQSALRGNHASERAGSTEFLLAIATGQMRLEATAHSSLLERLAKMEGCAPLVEILRLYLLSKSRVLLWANSAE